MSDLDSDPTYVGGNSDRPNDLHPGDILGEYRIEGLLGSGAMGQVYLAEHQRLKRKEAVKILPQELVKQHGFVERFNREAQALAGLDCKNVVRIHTAGDSQGHYYLAMEYVEGGTLEEHLERSGGTIGSEEAQVKLLQVLDALEYAHGKGIIHRDIKPANVLITEDGTVKVSDFGLAQVVGDEYVQTIVQRTITATQLNSMKTVPSGASGSKGSTGSSDIAGTVHYMAPEVQSGQGADLCSDLYAVGVMAYKMLTGRMPVGRYKPASALVAGLSKQWDAWIDRLMEPEPVDRYQEAAEAREELEKVLHKGTKLWRAGETRRAKSAQKRTAAESRRWLWISVTILIFALGGFGYYSGVYAPEAVVKAKTTKRSGPEEYAPSVILERDEVVSEIGDDLSEDSLKESTVEEVSNAFTLPTLGVEVISWDENRKQLRLRVEGVGESESENMVSRRVFAHKAALKNAIKRLEEFVEMNGLVWKSPPGSIEEIGTQESLQYKNDAKRVCVIYQLELHLGEGNVVGLYGTSGF